MPASLLSLKIRGVRSYSPYEHKTQVIDFMPLTLIVGPNGNGKTTIIESLKFVISGEEPPLSDSRRNFLHTAKEGESFDKKISYASIRLDFQTARDEICVAKREILKPVGKALTPSISSSYKIANKSWNNVHKQDDWNKTVPLLFNLPSQAMLNNVILCHQEENLWCMGPSSEVKQIFDKIFGCEQYKKEIKNIDAEIKTCKSEMIISEKDLSHEREKVERKKLLIRQLETMKIDIEKLTAETGILDDEISVIEERRDSITKNITKLRDQKSEEFEQQQQLLLQKKCDQTELLDQLSIERQKLADSVRRLDGLCQGCLERIKSKENLLIRLNHQMAQADPVAKDLSAVDKNLEKMSTLTHLMPQSEPVVILDDLIKESSDIINNLMKKITKDDVDKIKGEIVKETKDIEDANIALKQHQQSKLTQTKQLSEIEAKCTEARFAAKEAHNLVSSFKKFDKDLEILNSEYAMVNQKLLEARDKRSYIGGSKTQISHQMERLKGELMGYPKVDVKFAEILGKIACNKIVLSDLEKLKECFQQSITTFHSQMIVRINEVLRVRWRQIYRGSDIDHIELVDEEITRGKDKRTFNYHIAMRKGGLRMRMREKSSAGQKALASIILRMTLAELFVKDFAFIALDEPTVNLDQENVLSLAKAIGSYVKRRNERGANIQWIIITHNEQFLKALDAECSPYYYRVHLDEEGCSKISKISYQDTEKLGDVSQVNF